jgi:hypothetical protein
VGQYLRGHNTRVAKQTSRRGWWRATPEPIEEETVSSPPVLRLLRASFQEVWEHRSTCLRRQEGRACPQCYQDREWMLATATTLLCYSFPGMCEVLGLEAELVRKVFFATAN